MCASIPRVSISDTGVARYNFDVHQPILIIFGRNVAEAVSYKKRCIIFLPHLTNAAAEPAQYYRVRILCEPPRRMPLNV